MPFSSFDALLLAMAFLVPGFVWEGVRQLFVRRREDHAHQAWIRFLTLSAFNNGLWSWLVYLLLAETRTPGRPWEAALAWSLVVFVSPAVLGAVTGLLSQRATVRRLLARCGIHTIHHVPTAWEYVFSQSRESWVLVTLMDGSTLAGEFGGRAFASSDRTERDLFLQRAYRVDDDGPWQPVPMSSGVWIHGQAIRTIEFFAFQE